LSKPTRRQAEKAVRLLIQYIGEDPDRQGLLDTPSRVVDAYEYFCEGYEKDAEDCITVFDNTEGYDEVVLLKNVPFYSTCEHHLLPFYGVAHIAYLPGESYVGLSKLARVLDIYARRLQIQERLTQQVCDSLAYLLEPRGVMVVLEAQHLCVMCRGVEKQTATAVTSALYGIFLDSYQIKDEVLFLLGLKDGRKG